MGARQGGDGRTDTTSQIGSEDWVEEGWREGRKVGRHRCGHCRREVMLQLNPRFQSHTARKGLS
eukprot:199279-Chlamydomonas_euryale.AAC.2